MAVCFPSSLALNKSPDVSTTSLPALAVTWPFDYSHPSLCAVEFLCGLICISLMNSVDHVLIGLLYIFLE